MHRREAMARKRARVNETSLARLIHQRQPLTNDDVREFQSQKLQPLPVQSQHPPPEKRVPQSHQLKIPSVQSQHQTKSENYGEKKS